MTDTHPRLESAAYALGALDAPDRALFESHLATCESCRAEHASFRSVVGLLGHAAPTAVPPPGLRERLIDNARQVRPISAALRPRASRAPWLAVAAAIPLVTLGGLAYRAERVRARDLASELAATRQELARRDSLVAAFLGPEVHVVSLADAEKKPSARVFWNHTRNIYIVTAFNVPRAPEGKTYQLWAIAKGKAPISMGTFNTDAAGRATVIVPVGQDVLAAGFIDNCAMTLEPAGGSPQPTEQPRLIGDWRHVD